MFAGCWGMFWTLAGRFRAFNLLLSICCLCLVYGADVSTSVDLKPQIWVFLPATEYLHLPPHVPILPNDCQSTTQRGDPKAMAAHAEHVHPKRGSNAEGRSPQNHRTDARTNILND